jgi:hypothetical protein
MQAGSSAGEPSGLQIGIASLLLIDCYSTEQYKQGRGRNGEREQLNQHIALFYQQLRE